MEAIASSSSSILMKNLPLSANFTFAGEAVSDRIFSYLACLRDILSNSYSHACPCSFYNASVKECSYTAIAIARYQKKISGPLIDRIDIHVEVLRVDYEKLADKRQIEDSKTIRARVQPVRERQLERFKGTKLTCNAEMGPTEVREFCQTDASGEKLLKAAVQQLHPSARAYHRVLKLARTIADLASSDMIMANHVAEAVQYRPRVGM